MFLTWIMITAEISINVTSVSLMATNMAKGGHIDGNIDGYFELCGNM